MPATGLMKRRDNEMAEDRLYDLAFAFKNTKLWEKLSDLDLFAVRLPGGEIGYCCVMGQMGDHLALAVYVGDEGFQSYRRLASADMRTLRPVAMYNMMASQCCIQCSLENREDMTDEEVKDIRAYAKAHQITVRGKHAYPQFSRHTAGRLPWQIRSKEDEERLCEGLLCALEVHRRLLEGTKEEIGLSKMNEKTAVIPLLSREGENWRLETTPVPTKESTVPEVEFTDQLLSARLKKKKKKGIWECAACWLMTPVQEDETDEEAPFYPLALMAANLESGMVLMPVISDGSDLSEMVHQFAQSMQECGSVPKTIRCGEERSFSMLRDLCEKTGIAMEKTDELEVLDDALMSLLDHMREMDEDEDDDDDFDDDEGLVDPMGHFEDLANAIDEVTDAELRQMPREVKDMLREFADMDVLPEETARRIRRVLGRKR